MSSDKTMKRELGYLFALILCWEIYNDKTDMVETIVWPFVSYIAAVSGLHIYRGMHGQPPVSPNRGRASNSGQHTDRQREQPDLRDK